MKLQAAKENGRPRPAPPAMGPILPDEGANLAPLLNPRVPLLRFSLAAGSGLLLSAAFPPLEWGALAWVALVPLLLLPPPPRLRTRMLCGWIFGFAHFATALAWLNEIGYGAGLGLALVCALFPALWYLVAGHPGRVRTGMLRDAGTILFLAALWVAFEWVRAWLLTGFPWNQLGISQWDRATWLALTPVTGVYGISFAVVTVNAAAALGARRYMAARRGRTEPLPRPWGALLALAPVAALTLAVNTNPQHLPTPTATLRTLAVQGNIPQCREWTEQQLEDSLRVYSELSAAGVAAAKPDLIVWPETAVPAPLRWDQAYADTVRALLDRTGVSLMVGTIDYRTGPASEARDTEPEPRGFNSVLLVGPEGAVLEYYDKTHLVPFGEYTPLEALWPWLTDLIGMGRSLTAGTEFTVFELPHGARAGVNICYEDAYPGISRAFVRRGANMLFTLTNDAWYAESAGSRQHLLHAVFRAAETRRPLLRSGNNSDTCLIMPNGEIQGLLRHPQTGSPFFRGQRLYEIPVWETADLGLTFYTRYGDLFAGFCAATSAAVLLVNGANWLNRKQHLLEIVTAGR